MEPQFVRGDGNFAKLLKTVASSRYRHINGKFSEKGMYYHKVKRTKAPMKQLLASLSLTKVAAIVPCHKNAYSAHLFSCHSVSIREPC